LADHQPRRVAHHRPQGADGSARGKRLTTNRCGCPGIWPYTSLKGPSGEAGATNPEQLGEQLALLLDGASARNRVLNTETFATAAVLIDNAIPIAAVPPDAGGNLSSGRGPRAGCGGELSRR
jgi:hypothetical protein